MELPPLWSAKIESAISVASCRSLHCLLQYDCLCGRHGTTKESTEETFSSSLSNWSSTFKKQVCTRSEQWYLIIYRIFNQPALLTTKCLVELITFMQWLRRQTRFHTNYSSYGGIHKWPSGKRAGCSLSLGRGTSEYLPNSLLLFTEQQPSPPFRTCRVASC
jgi:hypothetical protein